MARAGETAQKEAASAKQIKTNTAALESQMDAISKRAKADSLEADYDLKFMDYTKYNEAAGRLLENANSAKGVITPFPEGRSQPKTNWKDIQKQMKRNQPYINYGN